MDFGSVLYTAQKNDQNGRQANGWYKTEFAPPKKEQREKKLSLNIQKFLARKEEEEKQKKFEADRKKQDLLALRSQDKKSVKRVQSMLKRTKSANKSVLADAVDHDNTAVTAAGPLQPDEDDYGYVSQNASDLYNQLINKYNSAPTEDPFSKKSNKTAKDISTTKDRVKAALQREEDEKLLPRKRKRKSKDGEENHLSSEDSDGDSSEKKNDEKPKSEKFKIPKKNPQASPPIDFQSLLKLAEKKQHEPIVIQKQIEEKPERPMTQKEKLEYMRERERKIRREMGVTNNNSSSSSSSNNNNNNNKSNEPTSKKEVKFKGDTSCSTSASSKIDPKRSQKRLEPSSSLVKKSREPALPSPSSSNREKPIISDTKKLPAKVVQFEKPKLQVDRPKSLQKPERDVKVNPKIESSRLNDKPKPQPSKILSDSQKAILMKKAKEQYYAEQRKNAASKSIAESIERDKAVKSVQKPFKMPEKRDAKPMEKKPAPSSKSQGVREFPPRDMVRQFPPPDMVRKKPPPKPVRRRAIESDDEYDSEMDDFIDDTEDPNDVSKYISEIFGYDRSKYSRINEEDDDECMESNFSDLQKEEFISTKYGIMEDLEDVRRTKLEKQRKKKRFMSRADLY